MGCEIEPEKRDHHESERCDNGNGSNVAGFFRPRANNHSHQAAPVHVLEEDGDVDASA